MARCGPPWVGHMPAYTLIGLLQTLDPPGWLPACAFTDPCSPPAAASPAAAQLPRKLGAIASSQLVPDPYAQGPHLASVLVETVGVLLRMTPEGSAQVKSAMLLQIAETGLFRSLDLLAEATAQQLEQFNAALTAAGASGGRSAADVHEHGSQPAWL